MGGMPALLATSRDLARKALMTSGPAPMFAQEETSNGRSVSPASLNCSCWTPWYEEIFRLVPAGTSLKISSYQGVQQLQFKLAGLTDLPFEVSSWANIGAGPDVINAFRAKSLDVANNAGIPPIQAHYQGFDAKIVAINLTRRPNYLFATKPGSDIRTVADFKGKKLAFSQGQAQGVVLL